MALSNAAVNYKRVGPGNIYLAAAPTADITAVDDYYKIFFGSTGTAAAAKKALQASIKPWATMDKSGMTLKIQPSKVTFDPNNAPKVDFVTGIDTATVEFTMYDVDPAHLVDIFGSQAADLTTVAAASGVAARQIAILGPQSYNTPYCVLYRMPSQNVPGEYFHYLFPNATILADLEIKMSKGDAMTVKVTLQLSCSPFVMNSAGFGAVCISDDPTAPGL